MAHLKEIGAVYRAGADGVLPRIGSAPTGDWQLAARDAANQLHERLGASLDAVILRGSAARAMAVVGSSDLDLIALTKGAHAAPESLDAKGFPELDVEVITIPSDDFLHTKRWQWMRFNLAFCGWTVWGRDVLEGLPEPVLDRSAIAHLHGLSRWIEVWAEHYAAANDRRERHAVCRWVMKRCVRSAFEGVMIDKGVYSRDLYPCAKIASEEHPLFKNALFSAAELAVAPTESIEELSEVVSQCRPLLEDLNRKLLCSRRPHS